MYLLLQGFKSKGSNNLVITSLAIYDHITSTLLHPSLPISDPLVKSKRKTSRNPQEKDEGRFLPDQNLQEEGEYVLDSAPPPLTLGILNTKDVTCGPNKYVAVMVCFLCIAQKLGLVACPAPGLTEGEWRQVKARSIQEGESGQPCTICREEFLLQPQVFPRCCLKELLLSVLCPQYFSIHTCARYTQKDPFLPPPAAVPVCSNLCRQLYKFAHTALELNCDAML